jgi:hypothetical protein
MKKKIALLLSMLLVFLLVACGSKEANQTQTVQTQDAQSQGSGQFTFQGEVPLESKLLFGSLMLEGTRIGARREARVLAPAVGLRISLLNNGQPLKPCERRAGAVAGTSSPTGR